MLLFVPFTSKRPPISLRAVYAATGNVCTTKEREVCEQKDSAFAVAQYRASGSVNGVITDLLANVGVSLFALSSGVVMMGLP